MTKNGLIPLLLLLCLRMAAAEEKDFDTCVRQAVACQMQTYPESTLKDLYKNFFQDKFGPGHIISDTTAAGKYLRRELASYSETEGAVAEPTGWEGNFLRVNLSVLKTGQIPYDVFFDAFIRSVQDIRPIPLSEWQKEWAQIEGIIRSLNLPLPAYEADRKEIEERLSRGEYVGHHSQAFEDNYTPHYRIIRKDLFEKELLSRLGSSAE